MNAEEIALNLSAVPKDGNLDPDFVYWSGWTCCDLCGYGTDGNRVISIVPIPRGTDHPVVAMECPGCGNGTLREDDDD